MEGKGYKVQKKDKREEKGYKVRERIQVKVKAAREGK
jgi:hypothetical protein